MQDTFDRAPRTGELARELGLHPVYLARVFRRYFGCSIKQYVQQIRLRRAMEQLAATQTPLTPYAGAVSAALIDPAKPKKENTAIFARLF